MGVETISRWHGGALEPLDYCDMTETSLLAADSWRVVDGRVRGLDLHRRRFLEAIGPDAAAATDAEAFWDATVAGIPADGDWFPRVELQLRAAGGLLLVSRLRSSPETTSNVVVATAPEDPRRTPGVKGPDLDALLRLRTAAQSHGAGEAVLLSPDGFVVDGTTSALVWWRGSILCLPPDEFERVPSVTARSVLALAAALGVETFREAVTPAELDGVELWSLSALQGARIVTSWVDGPAVAELPGRLREWRLRLDALRRPAR